MCGVKDFEKGAGGTEKTLQVESLPSARQAGRVAEVISAARAKLEGDGEVLLTIPAAPEPQTRQHPLDRPHLRRQRMLTVSMRILVIVTAVQALFVFTSPLHLGRYSGASYWAEIILGISYIALGMSVIAVCVLISVRSSWIRLRRSRR